MCSLFSIVHMLRKYNQTKANPTLIDFHTILPCVTLRNVIIKSSNLINTKSTILHDLIQYHPYSHFYITIFPLPLVSHTCRMLHRPVLLFALSNTQNHVLQQLPKITCIRCGTDPLHLVFYHIRSLSCYSRSDLRSSDFALLDVCLDFCYPLSTTSNMAHKKKANRKRQKETVDPPIQSQ